MNRATTPPSCKPLIPALHFAPELLLKAQGIAVAFFDVDGVLTSGDLYFSEAGESLKCFHTLDGHGIKLLQQAGITPVVISGRDSAALRKRLAALGVTRIHLGTEEKLPAAQEELAQLQLSWSQAAAMGDDWPDLPLLQRAALACCPPGGHAQALALADHVTQAAAGRGAAREFCDLLLAANGHYARFLAAVDAAASGALGPHTP